jgi:adenylate kinase family enzyme
MSLIVIGHSGSGKTTWSKKFCQENNYQYVDLDEYMDEICEKRGWKQLPVTEASKMSDQYRVAICMQALTRFQGKRCVFDGIYFLSLPIALLKAYTLVLINPEKQTIIEQRRNRCKNHPKGKFKHLSDDQIDDLAKAMIDKYDDQIQELEPYADLVIV